MPMELQPHEMKPRALLEKQEHCVYYLKDSETTEILYGGAAGGGKSVIGCLWLIEMCQTYKGSRWIMGRSKLTTLKESTLNTFFEQATILGISNQFKYNQQSNIIYWNNGSEILLKDLFLYPSDPNFDRLGSLEICGAFIDEVNQIDIKAWMVVKSRIRYKLTEFNIKPKLLGSCNPAKNWVYSEFYLPAKKRSLKPYRRFIQALPKDNPHLNPEYITNLLQMDKNSQERLLRGNWEYDDDPTVLMDLDAISNYFMPDHIERTGKKYMTIDVARLGADKTVFRIWDGFLCIKRFAMEISPIDEIVKKAKELQAEHGVPRSNIVADEDGVGGGVVDFLKCKGFVNNSSPLEQLSEGENKKQNFENLRSQCAYLMAKLIAKHGAGEICDDVQLKDNVSKEMEQVKLKSAEDGIKIGIVKKSDMKKNLGNLSPDDWDSIFMRYYFELKQVIKVRKTYYKS